MQAFGVEQVDPLRRLGRYPLLVVDQVGPS